MEVQNKRRWFGEVPKQWRSVPLVCVAQHSRRTHDPCDGHLCCTWFHMDVCSHKPVPKSLETFKCTCKAPSSHTLLYPPSVPPACYSVPQPSCHAHTAHRPKATLSFPPPHMLPMTHVHLQCLGHASCRPRAYVPATALSLAAETHVMLSYTPMCGTCVTAPPVAAPSLVPVLTPCCPTHLCAVAM